MPVLSSSSADDFIWPTHDELVSTQAAHDALRPVDVSRDADGLYKNHFGAVWIPDVSEDLQLRLCVIAHTGSSRHRAATATEHALRQHFFWSTISEDIKPFVCSCIHYLSTVGGGKIPRPFGPAVHGTAPINLLQFDYIEIAAATSAEKYILMLQDGYSNFCWLFAFPDTDAENAARAIID